MINTRIAGFLGEGRDMNPKGLSSIEEGEYLMGPRAMATVDGNLLVMLDKTLHGIGGIQM